MMINSAEEFVRLRFSDNMEEYLKAAWDEAPFEVWCSTIPANRLSIFNNK